MDKLISKIAAMCSDKANEQLSTEFYCCVMYSGVEYIVCCYSECISHTRQAEKSA